MLYKARFRATNAEKVKSHYLTAEQKDNLDNYWNYLNYDGRAEEGYILHLPSGKKIYLQQDDFKALFEVGNVG